MSSWIGRAADVARHVGGRTGSRAGWAVQADTATLHVEQRGDDHTRWDGEAERSNHTVE